jgi:predicted amidohydrolase YtcJ
MRAFAVAAILLFLLASCTPENEIDETLDTLDQSSTIEQAQPTATTESAPVLAQPEIFNLALNAPVTASAALEGSAPELAVDGKTSLASSGWWGAGDFPQQWIEIDLGAPANITSLKLLTSQDPAGETQHRIFGCTPSGEMERIHEFRGPSQDAQWLEFTPEIAWLGFSCLRIETLKSPSWVAWREIEIYGYLQSGEVIELAPTPAADVPTLIFYNGEIISMEEDLPIYEAIAIRNELILALGTSEEILALASPLTHAIDLEGHTMMPGIVDAHTHLLSDSGTTIQDAQQVALEHGITTLNDMSLEPHVLEEFQQFHADGLFRVRANGYLTYTNNCGEIFGDWYQDHPPSFEFGSMFRITGVKVFEDGGTCGLPAISWEYPTVGGYGDLFFSQEEMNTIVQAINANGYQIGIHAQGDVAIEVAQNALATVIIDGHNPLRHRIDHNPFHRPDLVGRYAEIGIYPVIFGSYSTCVNIERDAYAEFFGSENLGWLENWRAFLDANEGWPVAWHGDDPWVVPLSPFKELFGMVTRAEVAEDGSVCEPADWLALHAITVEEALPMMTINSAFVLHRDQEVGSLEPGKLADLLIISANPLTIDLYEIKDIFPLMTMVGGNTEHCLDWASSYCP